MTWAASLGLFAWGGLWLDGKVGTKPLFLLVGCALGGIGGFIHFLATLAPEVLPWKKRQGGAEEGSAAKRSSEPQQARPPQDGRIEPEEP